MSGNRWSGVHGKNSGLDGDKTSTGAVCYAGSQGWSVNGRRKLYVGDKTSSCPRCGQPGVIVSGDPRQTNPQGRAVVVYGSPVRCGCAEGTNYVIAAGNPLTAKIISAQSQPVQQPSSRNTLRFQCADDDGRLMIACRYVLMFPDGHTETGITDNEGMTEWHSAESAENINLHILMD
ncbi:PAAR domain-containing protein [Kluyvera ascorbata]|uniref:PAAR domain-containing protein n=1 Tax=Kluyvera ascorbata TaxID=51288 RepID=UPI000907BAC9|nr:PAAR domain-containing protein [Kluyvera ascorbata]EJG2386052.1 PAAR domain-containing protein [Kluyvera ascorbata]MDU1195147.1 PAAR domain-containing protein [Kluyvera ascorbata]HBL0732519.1 PAAR domain-containing protein [Kluyvera ascorbata]HDG1695038.1 PAAR domain-containing protein [Kluyvera ascorbata]HDG1701888.1 PAAR domain-containing protein [Kluyvera ascorbata]